MSEDSIGRISVDVVADLGDLENQLRTLPSKIEGLLGDAVSVKISIPDSVIKKLDQAAALLEKLQSTPVTSEAPAPAAGGRRGRATAAAPQAAPTTAPAQAVTAKVQLDPKDIGPAVNKAIRDAVSDAFSDAIPVKLALDIADLQRQLNGLKVPVGFAAPAAAAPQHAPQPTTAAAPQASPPSVPQMRSYEGIAVPPALNRVFNSTIGKDVVSNVINDVFQYIQAALRKSGQELMQETESTFGQFDQIARRFGMTFDEALKLGNAPTSGPQAFRVRPITGGSIAPLVNESDTPNKFRTVLRSFARIAGEVYPAYRESGGPAITGKVETAGFEQALRGLEQAIERNTEAQTATGRTGTIETQMRAGNVAASQAANQAVEQQRGGWGAGATGGRVSGFAEMAEELRRQRETPQVGDRYTFTGAPNNAGARATKNFRLTNIDSRGFHTFVDEDSEGREGNEGRAPANTYGLAGRNRPVVVHFTPDQVAGLLQSGGLTPAGQPPQTPPPPPTARQPEPAPEPRKKPRTFTLAEIVDMARQQYGVELGTREDQRVRQPAEGRDVEFQGGQLVRPAGGPDVAVTGQMATARAENLQGEIVQRTDSSGRVMYFRRDSNGKLRRVSNAEGTTAVRSVRVENPAGSTSEPLMENRFQAGSRQAPLVGAIGYGGVDLTFLARMADLGMLRGRAIRTDKAGKGQIVAMEANERGEFPLYGRGQNAVGSLPGLEGEYRAMNPREYLKRLIIETLGSEGGLSGTDVRDWAEKAVQTQSTRYPTDPNDQRGIFDPFIKAGNQVSAVTGGLAGRRGGMGVPNLQQAMGAGGASITAAARDALRVRQLNEQIPILSDVISAREERYERLQGGGRAAEAEKEAARLDRSLIRYQRMVDERNQLQASLATASSAQDRAESRQRIDEETYALDENGLPVNPRSEFWRRRESVQNARAMMAAAPELSLGGGQWVPRRVFNQNTGQIEEVGHELVGAGPMGSLIEEMLGAVNLHRTGGLPAQGQSGRFIDPATGREFGSNFSTASSLYQYLQSVLERGGGVYDVLGLEGAERTEASLGANPMTSYIRDVVMGIRKQLNTDQAAAVELVDKTYKTQETKASGLSAALNRPRMTSVDSRLEQLERELGTGRPEGEGEHNRGLMERTQVGRSWTGGMPDPRGRRQFRQARLQTPTYLVSDLSTQEAASWNLPGRLIDWKDADPALRYTPVGYDESGLPARSDKEAVGWSMGTSYMYTEPIGPRSQTRGDAIAALEDERARLRYIKDLATRFGNRRKFGGGYEMRDEPTEGAQPVYEPFIGPMPVRATGEKTRGYGDLAGPTPTGEVLRGHYELEAEGRELARPMIVSGYRTRVAGGASPEQVLADPMVARIERLLPGFRRELEEQMTGQGGRMPGSLGATHLGPIPDLPTTGQMGMTLAKAGANVPGGIPVPGMSQTEIMRRRALGLPVTGDQIGGPSAEGWVNPLTGEGGVSQQGPSGTYGMTGAQMASGFDAPPPGGYGGGGGGGGVSGPMGGQQVHVWVDNPMPWLVAMQGGGNVSGGGQDSPNIGSRQISKTAKDLRSDYAGLQTRMRSTTNTSEGAQGFAIKAALFGKEQGWTAKNTEKEIASIWGPSVAAEAMRALAEVPEHKLWIAGDPKPKETKPPKQIKGTGQSAVDRAMAQGMSTVTGGDAGVVNGVPVGAASRMPAVGGSYQFLPEGGSEPWTVQTPKIQMDTSDKALNSQFKRENPGAYWDGTRWVATPRIQFDRANAALDRQYARENSDQARMRRLRQSPRINYAPLETPVQQPGEDDVAFKARQEDVARNPFNFSAYGSVAQQRRSEMRDAMRGDSGEGEGGLLGNVMRQELADRRMAQLLGRDYVPTARANSVYDQEQDPILTSTRAQQRRAAGMVAQRGFSAVIQQLVQNLPILDRFVSGPAIPDTFMGVTDFQSLFPEYDPGTGERIGNRTQLPNDPFERFAMLSQERAELPRMGRRMNALQNERTDIVNEMERRRVQLEDLQKQRQAQRDAYTARGEAIPEELQKDAELPDDVADRLSALGKRLEQLSGDSGEIAMFGKEIEQQRAKVAFLGGNAAKAGDVLKNLGQGFMGGVAAGLIGTVVSTTIAGIQQALHAIQPVVDDMTGGQQRANRTTAAFAQQLAGSGYRSSAVATMASQLGIPAGLLSATSGVGLTAMQMAGNTQMQQRADMLQADFVNRQRAIQLGLPDGYSPALMRDQGGMFEFFNPISGSFQSVGGQTNAQKILADTLANGGSRYQSRNPDMLQGYLNDLNGASGILRAIGVIDTGAQTKRLESNITAQNAILAEQGSQAQFRMIIPGNAQDQALMEQQVGMAKAQGLDDLAHTIADFGVVVDNLEGEANGFLDVVAKLARGSISASSFITSQNNAVSNAGWNAARQLEIMGRGNQIGLGMQGMFSPMQAFGTGIAAMPADLAERGAALDSIIRQQEAAGLETLKAWAGPEAAAAIAQAEAFGEELRGYQEAAGDIQATAALREYNRNLVLAKRSVADLAALTGQGQGSEIGRLERLNLLDQRRLQNMQFEQAQRSINFGIAMAGFSFEGATGEEAAARQRIARIKAQFEQEQLNIQRRMAGRGIELVDEQNLRAFNDAVYNLSEAQKRFNEGNRLAALSQLSERVTRAQAKLQGDINRFITKADMMEKQGIDLINSVAETTGKLISTIAEENVKELEEAGKRFRDALNGTPLETADPNGGNGNVGQGYYGDSSIFGGGRVKTVVNITFNNASIRNDQDIRDIAIQVERVMSRKAGMMGVQRVRPD